MMIFTYLKSVLVIWTSSAVVWHLLKVGATPNDDRYVEIYGNDPNISGRWNYTAENHINDTLLLDICQQAHNISGKKEGEVVLAAFNERSLEFPEKYQQIGIDILYYLLGGDQYNGTTWIFYITKGLKPDCVFYLKPTAPSSSIFTLDEHVCGITYNME